MSIYLGDERVGVSYATGEALNDGDEILTAAQKQALKEATEWRTNTFDSTTVAQMVAKLKADYFLNRRNTIVMDPYPTAWTRPQGWPDLDSLNLTMSGDDYIYMTYDADREVSAIAWHIETTDKSAATLEIGHITNGEYIADTTFTVNHNTNFVEWLDNYSGYIVVRITGLLKYCYSYSVTKEGQTQSYRQQPILERIAYIPHMVALCTAATSNAWSMWTLEREKIGNGDGTALTSLYSAWAEASRLRDLDTSNLKTQNVTNFNNAFNACYALKTLDLRHFNVAKATNFNGLFSECRGLTSVNLIGWDTANVTNFTSMFSNCYSLKNIYGLDTFNTIKATTFANMFNNCYSIEELPVSNFNTVALTATYNMFTGCHTITSLDLHTKSGNIWDMSKVTNISGMFYGCLSLKELNCTGWQTGTLTSIASLFNSCYSLENIDISWLHITSACTNICNVFSAMWSIQRLDIPNDWDVTGLGNGNNTGNAIFSNCYSLKTITGISNWDFRFTNSLANIFGSCYSLETVNVSGWNVSYTTNLNSLFYRCYSLQTLDLSNWQPSNCTNFSSMFASCCSLTSIGNISNWNVSNGTTFASMFSDCESLQTFPNVSNWNMANATNVSSMFYACFNLTSISITNWNLAECTNVGAMFQYCINLKTATLTGWSMPKLNTAPGNFLNQCYNLTDLYIDLAFAYNHSYGDCRSLTHESVIRILNSLPTVSSARTLNLRSTNINRLSAAEKAIATSKGWTLAN